MRIKSENQSVGPFSSKSAGAENKNAFEEGCPRTKKGFKKFCKRFNLEAFQILDPNAGVAFDAFIRGLRPGSFKFDLVKKNITTLAEALREAKPFINATKVCAEVKHPEAKKAEESVQPKKNNPKKAETWELTSMTTSSRRSKRSEPATSMEPIGFSKDQYSILMEIKDQHELKAPVGMKAPYRNRDKSKYCHFHRDCGHETNECKHLKRALQDLAQKGKMNSYLPQWGRKFQKRDDCQSKRKESDSTDEDVVLAYLEVLQLEVVVNELDRGKLRTPHDEPLVVEMKIANLRVRRILIDTGSSTDIRSADCLLRLKFNDGDLVPPTLNHIKAVIVTHLILMKFECDGGRIGSLYGDQQAARECDLTTLKPSSWRGEKLEQPKATDNEAVEIVKGQIDALRTVVERSEAKVPPMSKLFSLLPSKKRKFMAIKEEEASS
ncbi:uncharacterized protein LOC125493597 [Beta vulgaris subsp. vulgaris]|uniref:uncharacterized protein LOC125493597 n=1 Tax=Beta vulgaris subsp. vulgaris TaxID=3555 RepID=UPI002036E13C|nr:uncharacterized protein LOC125493597 [Beta vulgaris subsp. vulgaris]